MRLGEIDTPERKQPYGTRAQQALSELAYNKQARVVVQDTDRYGRTVGRVYVGSLDVNAEMVKQGAAWAYRQVPQGSIAADAGSGSQGRQAGLVGTAGSGTLPALGLAQECVSNIRRNASARPPHRRPVRRQPPPAAASPAPASGTVGK